MAGYVSLQDVTKTYQMGEITIKAADGISFDVEKGEFVICLLDRAVRVRRRC